MTTTTAAVLNAVKEPLTLESLTVRDPGPGEVLVRVHASGVCHSDLHAITGDLPMPLPLVLGHEGAGIVEAVGPGVLRLRPGSHVILNWVPFCGDCWYCRSGQGYLCEVGYVRAVKNPGFRRGAARVNQFAGVGTMTEYTLVPESGAIPIDPDVPLDRACLVGCAVMTGVGAVINTARVQPGQSVAVFGVGGVGLNVVQGAVLAGAWPIVAVDLNGRKLELARQLGATHTVDAGAAEPVAAIQALTGGRGADVAFEAIGRPEVIAQAFAAVRRGGKAVVVGVAPAGAMASVPAVALSLAEKSLIGSLYGSANMARDVPRLLDLYRAGRLKLDELVSRRFGLDQVTEAFRALEKGEVARGVITFG